jgi:hypothetical protein
MVGAQDGSVDRSQGVQRRAARPLVDSRWLVGILLFAIGICAIVGVVVATAMGETTAALIIGIVAGAFFTRVAC